jgi:hypothetical protein
LIKGDGRMKTEENKSWANKIWKEKPEKEGTETRHREEEMNDSYPSDLTDNASNHREEQQEVLR